MARSAPPLFLGPRSYRLRRLTDAVRLLPVVGTLMFLVPLLWTAEGVDAVGTAGAIIYVFCVWALLIGVTALLSPRLERATRRAEAAEQSGAGPSED